MIQSFGGKKRTGKFLIKLSTSLTNEPYSLKTNTSPYPHKDLCADLYKIFIHTGPKCKQPTFSWWMNEEVNKLGCIHAIEHYSAKSITDAHARRNESNLQSLRLRDRALRKKTAYSMLLFVRDTLQRQKEPKPGRWLVGHAGDRRSWLPIKVGNVRGVKEILCVFNMLMVSRLYHFVSLMNSEPKKSKFHCMVNVLQYIRWARICVFIHMYIHALSPFHPWVKVGQKVWISNL